MNQQIGGREPHRAAPVRIPTLEFHFGFPRFVTKRSFAKAKRMLAVVFGQAPNPMRREKFVRVPDPLKKPLELIGIGYRQNVTPVAITDGVACVSNQIGTILDEPLDVPQKVGVCLELVMLQNLDRVERNKSHQRAQTKLVELAVGIPQYIVEESVR